MKKFIIPFLTFIVIVVPGLFFGYVGKPTEMGLAIVLGALAGAFLNIDKFERFSGAGFEAELKKAVEEAYATIENLKDVAKPLMVSTLSNLTYMNRFDGMDETEKHKYKEEIVKIANDLKITDDDLTNATATFHKYHSWDFYGEFINKLYEETNNVDLRNKLDQLKDYESFDLPTKEVINTILKEFDITLSNRLEEVLNNYLHYVQNGKLRNQLLE